MRSPLSASLATFTRRLSARPVRASSRLITRLARRRRPPEKSSMLTSPSTTTRASVCNSAWAVLKASAIVEGDETHLVAFLVLHHPQVDDQPRHGLGITRRPQVDDALAGEAPHLAFVFVDRMAGEVETEGVLLALQAFLERQFAGLAVVGVDIRLGFGEQPAEQVHMAAFLAARRLFGGLHRLFHRS